MTTKETAMRKLSFKNIDADSIAIAIRQQTIRKAIDLAPLSNISLNRESPQDNTNPGTSARHLDTKPVAPLNLQPTSGVFTSDEAEEESRHPAVHRIAAGNRLDGPLQASAAAQAHPTPPVRGLDDPGGAPDRSGHRSSWGDSGLHSPTLCTFPRVRRRSWLYRTTERTTP